MFCVLLRRLVYALFDTLMMSSKDDIFFTLIFINSDFMVSLISKNDISFERNFLTARSLIEFNEQDR